MSEGERGRERERKEEMGRGTRLPERRRWGKGEGEDGEMGWRLVGERDRERKRAGEIGRGREQEGVGRGRVQEGAGRGRETGGEGEG